MLDVSVHVTQGALPWEALAAIGPPFWAWWFRPTLEITYEPGAPCCRDAPFQSGEEAHWIRVKVTNKGRGAAKRCIGKMIAVYGADDRPRDDRDPMRLYWVNQSWEQPPEPLDLARHEFEYLGVVWARSNNTDAALISTYGRSSGFAKELEAGQVHRVRLAVYADNAEPKKKEFIITFGGDIHTLEMQAADRFAVQTLDAPM